jgi:hypothetical protein
LDFPLPRFIHGFVNFIRTLSAGAINQIRPAPAFVSTARKAIVALIPSLPAAIGSALDFFVQSSSLFES